MGERERFLEKQKEHILKGGRPEAHEKNAAQGKLFVRERLKRLFDDGAYVLEDGLFANWEAGDLPADGVVTAIGKINGQTVCVMANDSTVKAGSWGAYTVEKILRIQETAERLGVPMLYLVDSAGARITDQLDMFPGRRGAGRIFYNQVRLSGQVPQVCLLFGPSAAGGAYIPAFCDVVFMVEGHASMYLGSPRMAEMVIGEKVTLEEMGGARMHATISGVGDNLAPDEPTVIRMARQYLTYMPANYQSKVAPAQAREPQRPTEDIETIVPEQEHAPFNMYDLLDALLDADSFFEIKPLFAQEIITGFGRLNGEAVAIVANQPRVKGGVLFVDSADKAARFITLADAFGIPLIFLADVPGFMIGSKVERQGIIRHGAKMIAAMSEATVPKISVVVRKAYGAGLYAMAGPGFEPDAVLALPGAQIAVMGAEAAVNAVYQNKIAAIEDETLRRAFIEEKRRLYREDINLYKVASRLIVDDIVPGRHLRKALIERLDAYRSKQKVFSQRKHPVYPV